MDVSAVMDDASFAALTERHRRELQVHCYRMLGSFDEAEDVVQEAFLRAWKGRDTYAGQAPVRAWLYRIATNACLDHLERHARRPLPAGDSEVTWLQPVPDRLLDDAAPDEVVLARETIELAFLVALQHLPPRQRAVLLLRDVLGWPAAEAAALLGSSVASANSALQRARATLRTHLPRQRGEWAPAAPTEEERGVLRRFIEATERADTAALAALMREDAVFTMPPQPDVLRGRDTIIEQWAVVLAGPDAWGEFRCLPTWANRQPAVANYLRRRGDTVFRALALDVLRVEDGVITEVTTFESQVFARFDLPAVL